MRKIEALRRAASFESSLASQLRKINKINYLRGHRSSAYVSLVPSVICDGQAALYDVRLVRLDDTPAHGYWAVYSASFLFATSSAGQPRCLSQA